MTRRRYLSTWLQRRVAGEGPLSAVCLNSTEPQHLTQPNHAHEDHSPPRSRYQAATPHAPGIVTPGSSENPVIIWISGRKPALDYLAETIIMMVEAVALSVKHSNQLQLKL